MGAYQAADTETPSLGRHALPTFLATLAGFGLGMSSNVLQATYPTAPHSLFLLLFWGGLALAILPTPIWAAWNYRHNFLKDRKRLLASGIIVAEVFVLSGMMYIYIAEQTSRRPQTWISATEPALLRRIETDFPNVNVGEQGDWDGEKYVPPNPNAVRVFLFSDMQTMGRFVAFYIPQNKNVFAASKNLAEHLDQILEGPTNISLFGNSTRLPLRYSRRADGNPDIETVENPKFTGAVYLYHEGHLESAERVALAKLFMDHGATLFPRGSELMKLEGSK
jgi:hypothetical protein